MTGWEIAMGVFLILALIAFFWPGRNELLAEFEIIIEEIPEKKSQPRDAHGRFTKAQG